MFSQNLCLHALFAGNNLSSHAKDSHRPPYHKKPPNGTYTQKSTTKNIMWLDLHVDAVYDVL